MQERIAHTVNKAADLDLTKPVPTKQLMAEVNEEDCYTQLWNPEDKLCSICASFEICGILYNARLTKKVAKREKDKGGYLDNMHFDSIDKDELIQWLRIKPRTTQQLVDKIAKFSECPDPDTIIYWVKSFIIETPEIKTKGGIVIVKQLP